MGDSRQDGSQATPLSRRSEIFASGPGESGVPLASDRLRNVEFNPNPPQVVRCGDEGGVPEPLLYREDRHSRERQVGRVCVPKPTRVHGARAAPVRPVSPVAGAGAGRSLGRWAFP